MGRGHCDGTHSAPMCSFNPDDCVFEHHAFGWMPMDTCGGCQKDLGMRFPERDILCADNCGEEFAEPQEVKCSFYVKPVRGRSNCARDSTLPHLREKRHHSGKRRDSTLNDDLAIEFLLSERILLDPIRILRQAENGRNDHFVFPAEPLFEMPGPQSSAGLGSQALPAFFVMRRRIA